MNHLSRYTRTFLAESSLGRTGRRQSEARPLNDGVDKRDSAASNLNREEVSSGVGGRTHCSLMYGTERKPRDDASD